MALQLIDTDVHNYPASTATLLPYLSRRQLLDEYDIDVAILNPLVAASSLHNRDLANALMRAVNEWTAHDWCAVDGRWRGSITVNSRDPEASAREIEHWAQEHCCAAVGNGGRCVMCARTRARGCRGAP
ncbi:MAG: amidohydrolase family protein [bacterium]|nr:amidohydrolase family protein [bacterium]